MLDARGRILVGGLYFPDDGDDGSDFGVLRLLGLTAVDDDQPSEPSGNGGGGGGGALSPFAVLCLLIGGVLRWVPLRRQQG